MSPPTGPHGLDTVAIHAGEPSPRLEGAAVYPIFQSATYEYGKDGRCDLGYNDVPYLRCNNTPSHPPLNAKLAALEGGEAAAVTASGMAAISTTLITFLRSGDHLLAQSSLYGGTQDLLSKDFPGLGIEYTSVDAQSPANWEAALRPNTKVFYVETITNPLLEVADLHAVVAFAKKHGLISIIDSTFASPVNFLPLQAGFDIVVHSATKFLNGHSDLCAGVVIGSAAHVKQVLSKLNHFGGCLDPHTAFLLHRGLKTLGVRVRQQNFNALAIAQFLEQHPKVARVLYPGLPSHPAHARAKELFTTGFGGVLSFELHGGVAAANQLLAALTLPLVAVSLGGVETLITRPAITTHVGMTAAQREATGITEGLIRLAVGIEDAEDLLADFQQALDAVDLSAETNGHLDAKVQGLTV